MAIFGNLVIGRFLGHFVWIYLQKVPGHDFHGVFAPPLIWNIGGADLGLGVGKWRPDLVFPLLQHPRRTWWFSHYDAGTMVVVVE